MSDIRLLYPDFNFTGTITASASDATGYEIENTILGRRSAGHRLSARTNSDLWVNIDLGSGNDAAAEALFLANANWLQKDKYISNAAYGVNAVLLRSSSQSCFVPSSITGYKCHYDATRGATKDASDNVTSWSDLSALNGALNNSSNYATWLARTANAAQNNNAAVSSAGGGQWLRTTTGHTWHQSKAAISYFAVLYINSTPSGNQNVVQDASADTKVLIFLDTGPVLGAMVATGSNGRCSVSTSTKYIVSVVYDGSLVGNSNRLKIWLNGVQKSLTFTGTIPATTDSTTGLSIFRRYTVDGNRFTGWLGEFIGYDAALGTSDRQAVEEYLTSKWTTTNVAGSTSFLSETLRGTRAEDYHATFSTSAKRHWWLQLGCSVSTSISGYEDSKYPFSKYILGRHFDFGRDPVWGRRQERLVLHNGNREPRYLYEFEWRGITNAKIQDFTDKIGKYIDTLPVVITTSSYHAVLMDDRAVMCKISSFTVTPEYHNENTIRISFEELI